LNPILIGIIAGLSVFVISSTIGYFIRKYFFIQPKVRVVIDSDHASSHLEGHNKICLEWNYKIKFKNITKYDAINFKVNHYKGIASNNFTSPLFDHIKALSEEYIKLKIKTTLPLDQVEKSRNRFIELIPDEYKEIKIILTYQNEMNKKFYTRFIKEKNNEKITFHKFKPREK
jgi:hypothetical protein